MAGGSGSGADTAGPGPPEPPSGPFFRPSYLVALIALAAIYLVTSALVPVVWVELPLGILTLFLMPGYAIGSLALRHRNRWPWALKFALVVGWSVAVNVAMGLALLLLHLGLPPVAFGAVALGLLGTAWAVDGSRTGIGPVGASPRGLGRSFRLAGYRPAQRAAAYALV
ncbi:MAG: hypothetical protein ACREC5_06420, partial [Thermoplasmata archaeon]